MTKQAALKALARKRQAATGEKYVHAEMVVSLSLEGRIHTSFLEKYREEGLLSHPEMDALLSSWCPLLRELPPEWMLMESNEQALLVAVDRSDDPDEWDTSDQFAFVWATSDPTEDEAEKLGVEGYDLDADDVAVLECPLRDINQVVVLDLNHPDSVQRALQADLRDKPVSVLKGLIARAQGE